ncbi:MAG: endonuclease III [Lachnospiraceae bacterium]|jgi:endonuclease-3|nr:endonuclease III [Lachnospiraceae bacterium]
MTKEKTKMILDKLDQEYGTTKEGFLHQEDWQLLTAIMLSAQSTDKQVDEVLPGLWKKFPDLEAVMLASVEEVENAIKSIGLYKVKAKNIKKCCEKLWKEHDKKVPKSMDELVELPGVGRKTATLFLADAYGVPGVTVDTHVFRISKRIGWAEGKNPVQVEKELMKVLPREHWNRLNFQLIYHGRSVCTARKAHCGKCALNQWCEKRV